MFSDCRLQNYGEKWVNLNTKEFTLDNAYMNQIIDSIIATVRYGDPKHLKNDLGAILELYSEHTQQKENNG